MDEPLPDSESYNLPRSICLTPDGDLLFVDGHRVLRYDVKGSRIYAHCGATDSGSQEGTCTSARFNSIGGLAFSPLGELYIADSGNHCIRMVKKDGSVVTFAGKPGDQGYMDGEKSEAKFNGLHGLCFSEYGELIVADTGNDAIRTIDLATGYVTTVLGPVVPGENGVIGGRFESVKKPEMLFFDVLGRLIVYFQYLQVKVINPKHGIMCTIQVPPMEKVLGMYTNGSAVLYICASYNKPVTLIVVPIIDGTTLISYHALDVADLFEDTRVELAKRINATWTGKEATLALEQILRYLKPSTCISLDNSLALIIEGPNTDLTTYYVNNISPNTSIRAASLLLASSHIIEAYMDTNAVLMTETGDIVPGDTQLQSLIQKHAEQLERSNSTFRHPLLRLYVGYSAVRCLVESATPEGVLHTHLIDIDDGFTVAKVQNILAARFSLKNALLYFNRIVAALDEGLPIIRLEIIHKVPLRLKTQFKDKQEELLIGLNENMSDVLPHMSRLGTTFGFFFRVLFKNRVVYLPRPVWELGIKNGDVLTMEEVDRNPTLFVKTLIGKNVNIEGLTRDDYIYDIARRLFEKEGYPIGSQRLIWGGRQLVFDRTIGECGIPHEASIYLILRL